MLDRNDAEKIVQRVDDVPLFLHAYAFHLNMRCKRILPHHLLEIASSKALQGVKIHVLDGERYSLRHASDTDLQQFGADAQARGLALHVETSASDAAHLDEAVRIARKIGATSVRFYLRYEGRLSEVLRRVRADLDYLCTHYRHDPLRFTIEQHEDLKSHELVALVAQSGMDNLSILFDFANMINANEAPLAALETLAPYVTEVHMKDALVLREGKGLAHRACKSGDGDLPLKQLLTRLICLGDTVPQVHAYGLEEEVDYYAPPFRHDDEGDDPWIPWRAMSETPLPTVGLEARLAQEIADATDQIVYIRNTLAEIKQEALQRLL